MFIWFCNYFEVFDKIFYVFLTYDPHITIDVFNFGWTKKPLGQLINYVDKQGEGLPNVNDTTWGYLYIVNLLMKGEGVKNPQNPDNTVKFMKGVWLL